MRISDWSSDVCSSDRVDDRPLRKLWEGPIINSLLASNVCENLSSVGIEITGAGGANVKVRGNYLAGMEEPDPADTSINQMQTGVFFNTSGTTSGADVSGNTFEDRKSSRKGKRGVVRLSMGGSRYIKKQK